MTDTPTPPDEVSDLTRRVTKLSKINMALMQRVERSMDHQANAFSLFQTAINLENQIRVRTEELKAALGNLERVNDELVKARDTAERANRFKTRFFTAVGHDILQPVHAARLSLAELLDAEQTEATRELAGHVGRALTNIEDMLSTILDISKLEAGAFVPAMQPVSLAPMFASLLRDIEPMARRKNLSVRVRTTSLFVSSDPLMLRRMLQNLLTNSVRYTERGGLLLAARRFGSRADIQVWDTGPGIPDEDSDRIFEEFQQGSASPRGGAAGFGLGLSIVKRMAESLNHNLAMRSRPGRGSRFTITADVTEPPEHVSLAALASPPEHLHVTHLGFTNVSVIVIENDIAVLDAMHGLLRRWGCDVRLARDLDELDDIRGDTSFKPKLMIADYHLDDGVTGADAIERARALYATTLPAILITADHSSQTVEAARACRAELFHKPIRPAELRAIISHLVR